MQADIDTYIHTYIVRYFFDLQEICLLKSASCTLASWKQDVSLVSVKKMFPNLPASDNRLVVQFWQNVTTWGWVIVDFRLLLVYNVGAHLSGVEPCPHPETAGMGSRTLPPRPERWKKKMNVGRSTLKRTVCTPAAFLWSAARVETRWTSVKNQMLIFEAKPCRLNSELEVKFSCRTKNIKTPCSINWCSSSLRSR